MRHDSFPCGTVSFLRETWLIPNTYMTYSVHNVTLTVGCSILQYVAHMTFSYCIPSHLFFVCCPKASAFVLQMYVSIYYGFINMHTRVHVWGWSLCHGVATHVTVRVPFFCHPNRMVWARSHVDMADMLILMSYHLDTHVMSRWYSWHMILILTSYRLDTHVISFWYSCPHLHRHTNILPHTLHL